jgi:hypothetical protein
VQRREKKKNFEKKKPSLTSVKSILFPLHIILIFIISPEAIAENHSGLSKTDEPSEHKGTRGKKRKKKRPLKKTPSPLPPQRAFVLPLLVHGKKK